MTQRLLLASQSESRARLLRDAAIPFETVRAPVDEEAAKESFAAEGMDARNLADALAELKAMSVSLRSGADLVLGCDQTLELADGARVDKVDSRAEAAALLARMSAAPHRLHCAAVIAEHGRPVWRHIESVTLHVRPLSAAFIETYLDTDWEDCRWCVGCYRVEGPGAQLFSRIDGSLFAVQGLPLLPLLDYLRTRSIITS